ncbi:hypothetical protein AB0K34_13605 [Actinomadura sp. NPDC049382]|uniref:hypothetical protein n=1 Tax=Actinomadura sp. NPDC049382 TaxID=3158220 RepID=UPI003435D396
MKPFEPKGDLPEWQLIYQRVSTLDEGTVLTYDDLDEILGRDFRSDRSPIYRCITELEKADHRTLATVRGSGYRIAAANEHERLAVGHHHRSRRQMRKAVSKAASADRSKLTPEERKRIDGLEMSLRQHADMIRRLEARDEQRQAEIKALRRDTSADVAEISERVDRLTELLERHGVTAKPDAAA